MEFTGFGKALIVVGMGLVVYGTNQLPLPMYYGAITVVGATVAILGAVCGHKHD